MRERPEEKDGVATSHIDLLKNNNDHDEDDDEILVVSTTQQKWEQFHLGVVAESGGIIMEEEILVVKTRPARPMRDSAVFPTRFRNNLLHPYLPVFCFVFLLAAFAAFWYSKRNSTRRKRSCERISGKSNLQQLDSSKAVTTTTTSTTTRVEISKTTTKTVAKESPKDAPTVSQAVSSNISGDTPILRRVEATNRDIASSRAEDIHEETFLLQQTEHLHIETQQRPHLSASIDHKLEMARQLAQDIQLVQKVLQEQSMDPSLAPQLAVSLQSSRHFVESQRELHYQQAILTHHHRQLDRQLSQRQHQESLQAIKFDPNWQEKLQRLKQQCCNGWVRLWWEVFFVQQVTRGIFPVWRRYYSFDDNYNAGRSLVRDMAWSVATQLCDCHRDVAVSVVRKDDLPTTAFWTSRLAAYALALSNESGLSTSFSLLLNGLPPAWIDWDHCSCYGYCLLSAVILGMAISMIHYLLRMLCLPLLLHHVMNATALAFWMGPHRITMGIMNALKTLLCISTTDSSAAAAVECAMMLSILFVWPLGNWLRTHQLYSCFKMRVSKAGASEFEVEFRRGQEGLEQWKWEQMAARYFLLSVYTALLMGTILEDH